MTPTPDPPSPLIFSRRRFLQATGAVALVGLGSTLTSCGDDPDPAPAPTGGDSYPAVPPTPHSPYRDDELHFLTVAEATAIEAIAARIVPGSPDDPGAVECQVIRYIDHKMATAPGGFAQGIYRSGPFIDVADDGSATVDLPGATHIAADDVDRYGYQSSYDYREILRLGVASLDASVRSSGGTTFAELSPSDQDFVLTTLASGEASDFGAPGASTFFATVHAHVIEGMFCDPVYGGNEGLRAWKLVGYPGAQRAYTPGYIHGDEPEFGPQSVAEMIAFNPGRDDLGGDHVVSGAEDGHEHGDHPNP